jgi:hypothetical protein
VNEKSSAMRGFFLAEVFADMKLAVQAASFFVTQ